VKKCFHSHGNKNLALISNTTSEVKLRESVLFAEVDGTLHRMDTSHSSFPAAPGSSVSAQGLPYGAGRWYWGADQLLRTPSILAGITFEKELSYRQQAANFIQDMGQKLKVTQLCINTGIVYMQRFYMFHSFTRFHRNDISVAALFLAAKVEEQPRRLEHVIKVAHICLHRDQPTLDTRSNDYIERAQVLVTNENLLLQTLGFDVNVVHPHTHVVKYCQLLKTQKDLAHTSYFMATNSLHLTTMCLRYSPTVVACFCIHIACEWAQTKLPMTAQNRHWFEHFDNTVTLDLLTQMTKEFMEIFQQCPSRLKRKIKATEDFRTSQYQPDATSSSQGTPGTPQGQHIPDTGSRPSSAQGGHPQVPRGGTPNIPHGMKRPHPQQTPGAHPGLQPQQQQQQQPHPNKRMSMPSGGHHSQQHSGQQPSSRRSMDPNSSRGGQYPPGHPNHAQQQQQQHSSSRNPYASSSTSNNPSSSHQSSHHNNPHHQAQKARPPQRTASSAQQHGGAQQQQQLHPKLSQQHPHSSSSQQQQQQHGSRGGQSMSGQPPGPGAMGMAQPGAGWGSKNTSASSIQQQQHLQQQHSRQSGGGHPSSNYGGGGQGGSRSRGHHGHVQQPPQGQQQQQLHHQGGQAQVPAKKKSIFDIGDSPPPVQPQPPVSSQQHHHHQEQQQQKPRSSGNHNRSVQGPSGGGKVPPGGLNQSLPVSLNPQTSLEPGELPDTPIKTELDVSFPHQGHIKQEQQRHSEVSSHHGSHHGHGGHGGHPRGHSNSDQGGHGGHHGRKRPPSEGSSDKRTSPVKQPKLSIPQTTGGKAGRPSLFSPPSSSGGSTGLPAGSEAVGSNNGGGRNRTTSSSSASSIASSASQATLKLPKLETEGGCETFKDPKTNSILIPTDNTPASAVKQEVKQEGGGGGSSMMVSIPMTGISDDVISGSGGGGGGGHDSYRSSQGGSGSERHHKHKKNKEEKKSKKDKKEKKDRDRSDGESSSKHKKSKHRDKSDNGGNSHSSSSSRNSSHSSHHPRSLLNVNHATSTTSSGGSPAPDSSGGPQGLSLPKLKIKLPQPPPPSSQVPGSNAAATSKMSRAMGTSVENEQMFLASNTIHKKVLPSVTLKFK